MVRMDRGVAAGRFGRWRDEESEAEERTLPVWAMETRIVHRANHQSSMACAAPLFVPAAGARSPALGPASIASKPTSNMLTTDTDASVAFRCCCVAPLHLSTSVCPAWRRVCPFLTQPTHSPFGESFDTILPSFGHPFCTFVAVTQLPT